MSHQRPVKIVIASDHAGVALKEDLKKFVTSLGYEITDLGTNSTEPVDYPDIGHQAAGAVSAGQFNCGVLICGSGIGMCMTANRHKGVRAAVLRTIEDARLSRQHNDANIACIGARVTDASLAKKLLEVWFATPFEGGRHARRVEKIEKLTVNGKFILTKGCKFC